MSSWEHLRLFLAVARLGTLSSAAAELAMSVATLHRRIAALEDAVGVVLFDKGPRGYQLTSAGEALLPKAEEVEEAVFAAARAVVGHDQQASGKVRLTLPLVMVPALAPHFTAFAHAHPQIQLTLQADDAPLDLQRDTDLALRATSQPEDSAIGRKLFGLAWARYASAATNDEALPWVHYVGMDRVPAVQWRRAHHPSSHPMMRVHGVAAMHAVLAVCGVQGMLPCFVAEPDPRLRRLGEPVGMNELWLLVHADLRRSARVRAVMDFLIPRLVAERERYEEVAPSVASAV